MKNKMKKIISLVLVLAISFTISIPAFAADKDEFNTNEISSTLTTDVIDKADCYIKLSKTGKFYIKNKTELKKILTTKQYNEVILRLKRTNDSISKSDLSNATIDEERRTVTFYSLQQKHSDIRTATYEGVNKVEWHWFGVRIYLSRSAVQSVINAGVAGGAAYVGAHFAGVGAAVASAVAGSIISDISTSYITRGVYIDLGLKFLSLQNPGLIGVRGWGWQ